MDRQAFPAASCQQMKEIEGKIKYYACGSLLRIDTEEAGRVYMEAKKQANLFCPSIICQDNGSMLDASGVVSDDADDNAPDTLDALSCGYFGSMPRQERAEYHNWQGAVAALMPLVDLQSSLQQAEVSSSSICHHLCGNILPDLF